MSAGVELLDRLTARITLTDTGCWETSGAGNGNGYSVIYAGGRQQYVHRVAYELLVGPVPSGLVIDHLCRNRSCCNPDHLEPVTQRENLIRGEGLIAHHAAATECPQGHAYDEANTYRNPNTGFRACRKCQAAHERARRRRLRESA